MGSQLQCPCQVRPKRAVFPSAGGRAPQHLAGSIGAPWLGAKTERFESTVAGEAPWQTWSG